MFIGVILQSSSFQQEATIFAGTAADKGQIKDLCD